ncbi:MAG: DUF2460 domain-containing protein [Rickettsiales bacterium]
MQNFINQNFPSKITYGVEFGAEYQTEVVTTASGKEYRKLLNHSERKKFNLAPLSHNQKEIQNLVSFFQLVKGKLCSFRFSDVLDNEISNQQVGVGDGKSKMFIIFKDYYHQKQKLYSRRVYCPIAKTLKVKVNGRANKSYSLLEDGIIEFRNAPKDGAKITASCEYDTVVRFNNDYLPVVLEQPNLYLVEGLQLIEVI